MDYNLEILDNQQIEDFDILLNLLCEAFYGEEEIIKKIEKQVYGLLKTRGEDVNGLVSIALAEIMLDNRPKAVAVAHNIWEVGGEFSLLAEIVYLDILMNLGLLDLASQLIKEKFENIEESIEYFAHAMLKFSIVTGNTNLIDRVINNLEADDGFKALAEFTSVYKRNNYVEHFKNIQRILFETIKDVVGAYEYKIYTDRGFTDLEVFIYTGRETADVDVLHARIESRINSYFQAKGVKRIYNLTYTVRKISAHAPMIE